MMLPAIVLALCAYALLGALPLIFFRRGRVNRGWWLTAGPFFVNAGLLLGAALGMVSPLPLRAGVVLAMACVAVPLLAAAICLIGVTMGVHRVPVSMWHQADDAPACIVTWGPYARVRHPFYASFMLMLTGTVLVLPHAATFGIGVLAALQLNRTALREERRLLGSRFGAEYAAYMQRTGRFVPRRRSDDAVRADVVGKLAA